MDFDNLTKQAEEVEVLSAIYGSDWIIESETCRSYSITIEVNKNAVKLSVTMPEDYPTHSPPTYEISAPWMHRKAKVLLHKDLQEVILKNIGESVIFQCIVKIREVLQAIKVKHKNDKPKQKAVGSLNQALLQITCPEIIHGEVIVDRKSSFQGHAAEEHSFDDVKAVLRKLKLNKKILNAKHNMYAYRIERKTSKSTSIVQDCDDDGESHAGGRMLHLLQVLDQKNSLIICTRWYGGIQLGPDRFRHINNASRQALQQAGLIPSRSNK